LGYQNHSVTAAAGALSPDSKRWGQGGEINQALYAHMNNKRKMKKKKKRGPFFCLGHLLVFHYG
jgi:hypothetical protein